MKSRSSRSVNCGPALLWFLLTLCLFSALGIGIVLLNMSGAGDMVALKLESARYRVLELMPQPDRPEFLPTPLPTRIPSKPLLTDSNSSEAKVAATPTGIVQPPPVAEVVPPTRIPTPIPPERPRPTALPAPRVVLNPVQAAVQLQGVKHEAQRFNNCGPTTLRMYFSYYGYTKDTQVQIANVLKPNTEDKNVSPYELTGYAVSKGFHALYRINGDTERLKLFLSNNLPIMVETGYDPPRAHKGWMGHYLMITGYDRKGVTAQDSYDGPNQFIAWNDFDATWRHFNRLYLVLYTDAQAPMVETVIGDDLDDATMYSRSAARAESELQANPQDAFGEFNLGSSLVGLGEFQAAAEAYDRARNMKLPWRMLWYQFGPYEAYYQVGRYEELIALTDATQKTVGDLEESYYYKGLALEKLNRIEQARQAFSLALKYNPNYPDARRALSQLAQQ